MLNAKEELSGVKRTSKVVAPMPELAMHVARDFEPICFRADAFWEKMDKRRRVDSISCWKMFVRFGSNRILCMCYEDDEFGECRFRDTRTTVVV